MTGDQNFFPSSLESVDIQRLQNDCEDMEVSGNADVAVLTLHMATLLYQQNYEAARHLYRRHANSSAEVSAALQPYYKVCMFALAGNIVGTRQAMQELSVASSSGTATAEVYTTEIMESHRRHLLKTWVQTQQSPPDYFVAALGFKNQQEMENFMSQLSFSIFSKKDQSASSAKGLADAVAFLEIRNHSSSA